MPTYRDIHSQSSSCTVKKNYILSTYTKQHPSGTTDHAVSYKLTEFKFLLEILCVCSKKCICILICGYILQLFPAKEMSKNDIIVPSLI